MGIATVISASSSMFEMDEDSKLAAYDLNLQEWMLT